VNAPLSLAVIDGAPAKLGLAWQWAHDIKPKMSANWLIRGLLGASTLAVAHGHSGCGKTFIILDMGLHISTGWEWNGHKVQQGLVAYVAAEGGSAFLRRVEAWKQHHQTNERIPFAILPEALALFGDTNAVQPLIDSVLDLSAECGHPPRLIVIDTLSKTFSGRENSDELAGYVANCQRIVNATGATVLIIHHRPKDSESSEPRGHSSLKAGVDTVLLVEATSPKRITTVKQKDGEEGDKVSFDLRSVEIGRDDEGEPVTSCVVEIVQHHAAPIDPKTRTISKLRTKQALAWKVIQSLIEEEGLPVPTEIPDTEINRVTTCRVAPFVRLSDKLQNGLRSSPDENPDSLRRTAARVVQDLKTKDLLGTWGDWVWLKY
jgi:RecA-family ATPase